MRAAANQTLQRLWVGSLFRRAGTNSNISAQPAVYSRAKVLMVIFRSLVQLFFVELTKSVRLWRDAARSRKLRHNCKCVPLAK